MVMVWCSTVSCWQMGRETRGFHTYRGPRSIHRLFEPEMGVQSWILGREWMGAPLPAHGVVEGDVQRS